MPFLNIEINTPEWRLIVTFFIEKSLRLSNISFLGHQGLYAPDLKLANKNLLY